ncbi:choice-of-anchor P family protein [Actinosynnema sp. NPDC023587]|uniref:choice-of-anchor P family protein n=1 Tax=Actinosynnema sp. NPDC023587 TaxID=3154695 RepID=UPI0033FA477C
MRVRTTGFAALAAVAALLIGAAPAPAAPGDASAYGAEVGLSLLGDDAIAAGPFAAANAHGSTGTAFAGVDLPDLLTTGVVDTSASRDDDTGGVRSRASTSDVRLDLLSSVTGGITATAVEAGCTATREGVGGTTELVGLDPGRLGDVAAEPAPNTAVGVELLGADIARIVFNEQVVNPDGGLTVNAVRVTLVGGVLGSIGTGDVVLSSATCGPARPPIAPAAGAGLWLGSVMIALFAVPAAVVALHLRRANPAV